MVKCMCLPSVTAPPSLKHSEIFGVPVCVAHAYVLSGRGSTVLDGYDYVDNSFEQYLRPKTINIFNFYDFNDVSIDNERDVLSVLSSIDIFVSQTETKRPKRRKRVRFTEDVSVVDVDSDVEMAKFVNEVLADGD